MHLDFRRLESPGNLTMYVHPLPHHPPQRLTSPIGGKSQEHELLVSVQQPGLSGPRKVQVHRALHRRLFNETLLNRGAVQPSRQAKSRCSTNYLDFR